MSFIKRNFLLNNQYSEELFHSYAKDLPIIDYHCHLSPAEIANNKIFENITQIWISGDHYKWRAMRALGIDESFITGSASDKDKFDKWIKVIPSTMRNPLYHWSHLELSRYFNYDETITPNNTDGLFEKLNQKVSAKEMSTQKILSKFKVEIVCTTDDPTDDLADHFKIKNNPFGTGIYPTFRPDKAIQIDHPGFTNYINKLGEAADVEISSLDDLINALKNRAAFFKSAGCALADHGLNHLYGTNFDEKSANLVLQKVLKGGAISIEEADNFKSVLLFNLGRIYNDLGWTQQFHLGALRNTNTRKLRELGPDTGFDSISDYPQAENMMNLFDKLESENALTKTIIYNLNPSFNEVFATMASNYNDGKIKGKMQFGSGWWFLDQQDGMTKQLNTLSNMGILSTFIGMLTDSRSFMSFPRHEYFRRIVCNLFGTDIYKGELPNDMPYIGKMIQDICYYNAKNYFDFGNSNQ